MKPNIQDVLENGEFLYDYPIDESQTNSNAGDAEVFEYEGKKYEIITWNDRAIEHEEGEKEIAELPDED